MRRLDQALAERGLARSRTHAASLIAQGVVTVDGATVVKPSLKIADDAAVSVDVRDDYVSRAAYKLVAALDAFAIVPEGRLCLDLGASTGGFTQVLRRRGAVRVVAVDVGHDQMAAEVAADPAVTVVEGYNVRYMTRRNLAEVSGADALPSLVTGDLSFISLSHVLPAVAEVLAPGGDAVLLVKPQFEVGRTAVRGGLVTDPDLRADALSGVLWQAWDAGLGTAGVAPSPIAGTHGNAEYLVHFVHRVREGDLSTDAPAVDAGNPTEWLRAVARLTGGR